VLEAEHINPKLRAENLSLNDYIKISAKRKYSLGSH